ncbi:MAG: hypothetical protein IJ568_03255 [Bacilli bacterium]|nr:hypothetical protein [Bacilli bacterium]
MKKLNNNGWGLIIFLILIGLLFLALLVVALLANQYDGGLPSSRRGAYSSYCITKDKI